MKTSFLQAQFFQFHTVNSVIQQYKQKKYNDVVVCKKPDATPVKAEVYKTKAA